MQPPRHRWRAGRTSGRIQLFGLTWTPGCLLVGDVHPDAGGGGTRLDLFAADASCTNISSSITFGTMDSTSTPPAGRHFDTGDVAVSPSGAVINWTLFEANAGGVSHSMIVDWQFFYKVGQATALPPTPPQLPPDGIGMASTASNPAYGPAPVTNFTGDQICRLLEAINPTGWTMGTAFAISAAGSHAISGCQALMVTLDVIDPNVGGELGPPRYLIGAGRATVGNADGWRLTQHFTRTTQVIWPVVANDSLFGWNLYGSTSGTVTLLLGGCT
jgi:hypothetical protein